jgi:hypothetical protein
MKLCFATMRCTMLLMRTPSSNTHKVSGLCFVQYRPELRAESSGRQSGARSGRFQRRLIVGFPQPISFAARFRHRPPLVPNVAFDCCSMSRGKQGHAQQWRDMERGLFPEDGHSAVEGFTEAVCFLAHMHTLEVVLLQQMIAAVFKFVDSIQFKVAEWAHPGFV